MSQEISQILGSIYKPVIAEGDPAPPELIDVIQCSARNVLQRYVDAPSSTLF